MEVLKIVNLTKYYGNTLGVKDLSLTINKGEIFGFIGPNGAGKSTTIRSVMNLINKTNGEVYINGELFTKENDYIKEQIGYLPSEVKLYDDLSVKQIINYNKSFYNQIDNERLDNLITRLQLDLNKKIEELSLGNLKKLGIILSLMHNPKLLILDEASSGLDPLMQEQFYEILLEEKKKGTTIFYSTHNLHEINKICDRVGIIKDGQLIKVDSVNNLTSDNICLVSITTNDLNLINSFTDNIIIKENNFIKFAYSKNINDLISLLKNYKIEKLIIEEPSIEEIFMHYYN